MHGFHATCTVSCVKLAPKTSLGKSKSRENRIEMDINGVQYMVRKAPGSSFWGKDDIAAAV